jgi:periplasmic divalent cation tolerance protein
MTEPLVVLCTCPDEAVARRLAGCLVENRLAACVNILPEIRSIYRWQGELQEDGEAMMVIKATRDGYAALEARLLEEHPYDVPEVISLPLEGGSRDYLEWIAKSVVNESRRG